jgi:hypothetical protein
MKRRSSYREQGRGKLRCDLDCSLRNLPRKAALGYFYSSSRFQDV